MASGAAQGTVMFLHGTATTTLGVSTGDTVTFGNRAIAGDGDLVKTGSGVLALDGANTDYSGNVTLAGGTLHLGDDDALGSGTLTTTGSLVDYADGVTIGNRAHPRQRPYRAPRAHWHRDAGRRDLGAGRTAGLREDRRRHTALRRPQSR